MVYPHANFWGKKTSLIYSRSTNGILSEPLLRKKKTKRVAVNRIARINILRDQPTRVTIYNQRHQKLSERFVLPLCLENTARHLQLLHPSAEELNYSTRRNRVRDVLVNTSTFTWAYTRGHLKKGDREIRNSIDIGSFSSAMGCFVSKHK
jgi:hypothetical protein